MVLLLAMFAVAPAQAADDLDAQEQQAIAAAVDRVAPSVVRIETIGGMERVQGMLFGTGPTTGLVVDKDGYIISSAFNFLNQPSSILVRLADGSRKPAKLVATDHNRMLVLLKIVVDHPLPVAEIAPMSGVRVGQWAVAVGRTFEGDRPNMAVGIISALDRVWGKAIQTDASISPNNYGGPLVDIRGRVLGVLVPLSPEAADEVAGVQWYDSGIGFAVDAEHIQKILPRLKQGDLRPGLLGVSFRGTDQFLGEPVIGVCRPNSPAAKAGLAVGDKIVEIEGRPTRRTANVREQLGRHYAGDKIEVVVLREGKRLTRSLELAATLPAFEHGFLGVLPLRTPPAEGTKTGVTVRYVYPRSPAAAAGIAAGDVLVSLAGKPIKSRDGLVQQMAVLQAGDEAELEVLHAGQTKKVKLKLARLPEEMPPADIPPSRRAAEASGHERPALGRVPLKVAEFPNEAFAYIPQDYDPAVACGVVVWLHGPGEYDAKEILARWKPLCDRYDLILVAPKSADAAKWQPTELAYLEKLVAEVRRTYTVDAARTVSTGHDEGGTMASALAFRNRQRFAAVAVVDMPLGLRPPENDPLHRLAIYVARAKKSSHAAADERAISLMREMKIPVTLVDLGDTPRPLTPDELSDLTRWIDALDRI